MLEFTDLFIQPPGDFFYYTFIVLTLSAGFGIARVQRTHHPSSRTAAVYGGTLLGALMGWMFIIVGTYYAIYTDQSTRIILPPLERAVSLGFTLLAGWAFLTVDTDEPWRFGLPLLLSLITLTTISYIFTGLQWTQIAPTTDFNLTTFGVTWAFAQALISAVGLLLCIVFFRAVLDAPLKIVFFLILLLGAAGNIWQIAMGTLIGDYSGVARMALFLAVPIVPAVVYRKVIQGYELVITTQQPQIGGHGNTTATTGVSPQPSPPTITTNLSQPLSKVQISPSSSPVERESVQLLRTLGLILEETEPGEIPAQVVRASVEVLKADVGALLSIKDANYADILIAYDHAMRRPIPAMLSLNLEDQVTLTNAIERKQQRPLFVDRNPNELDDLYSRLDVPQVGPAYFQPLMRDDELIAVLVIGLPYAKRELRDAERELLKGIGIISGSLLSLSYAAEDATTRAEERVIQAMVSGIPLDEITDADILEAQRDMQATLDAVRYQNNELQKQVMQLKLQLDDERTRLTGLLGESNEGLSITQRIVELNSQHEQLRAERAELQRRLQDAETALASATGTEEDALFNAEIEILNREKRDLQLELEALRVQLEELRAIGGNPEPTAAEGYVEEMAREQERLETDRDQLALRLDDIRDQLEAMGIDASDMGLTQIVKQLYEQRSILQVRNDMLQMAQDALMRERRLFEARIRKEDERESQIETMEAEIRHLATDREAITRQRDTLRQERNHLSDKVNAIKEQRARLLADLSTYEDELKIVREQFSTLQSEFEAADSERHGLRAEMRSLQNERDMLIARLDGDRDRIQQLSNSASDEVREMIREVTRQRNQLLTELGEARTEIQHLKRASTNSGNPAPVEATNPELLMDMVDSLKTPMTSIVGYIDLLVSESAGLLGEMQRKFIQRISANVVRLETMLNDLAHLTALDTGTYQLDLVQTDVIGLIEDAITNANHQFREKDLILQIELDDSVPEIYIDVDGINQVIGQILTNAYIVSPVNGTITIQAKPHDGFALFAVRDSGGGIPLDEQATIFARRYGQDHQLVTGLGDTGVGLSIAQALVTAHGGKLWFESELGTGTTFFFTLLLSLQPEATG